MVLPFFSGGFPNASNLLLTTENCQLTTSFYIEPPARGEKIARGTHDVRYFPKDLCVTRVIWNPKVHRDE
jgi:hypothetical protein